MKNRFLNIKNKWKNLSVSHKLYTVVGIMALLIAIELFTLLFAMNTLSALRAFVGGEGIWSKAQKGAVLEIKAYARSRDERHYLAYLDRLRIPLGDHKARIEMQEPDMNMNIVRQGFIEGQIHPQDIKPMVELMRRFHEVYYLHRAIVIWAQGDDLIFQSMRAGNELHEVISQKQKNSDEKIEALIQEILGLNDQLTIIENEFSSILGEASRWLEHLLMIVLISAVATVESTGLTMTILISRGLSRNLQELNQFAVDIGNGDFSKSVPVRSQDELGQLASAFNKMAGNLKEITSERQIAEKANDVKNLFLANMSHEIRTPLNAILGFVDLLKDNSLTALERKQYLEIIERTGYSLATIINDILDISKVEAGKIEIERVPCSLKQVLRDLQSVLSLRCEEKGIGFDLSYNNLPPYVLTDPTRLKQILLNVMGNAIKFTNQGRVKATFEVHNDFVVGSIQDTGVGIAKKNVKKLFQPFSQLDPSVRKEFGGTGLGLILSKKIANLMGGDVILQSSEIGRGSHFIVSIKLEPVESQALEKRIELASPQEISPLRGRKILVVEDSIDNKLLAQQYLIRAGAHVVTASHGQEAIIAASKESYDLVLMDMQMPVMDGYTATAQLRRMGYQIPIIALTAHAMRDDLKKCIDAGCNAYLSKPFKRENLLGLVAQHCKIPA